MAADEENSPEQQIKNVLAYAAATDPYFLALGKFVHQYSILETVVRFVLDNVAQVSNSIGSAIFSGVRVSTARDFINRILDATGDPAGLKNRLKPSFNQIALINSMRDDILHYGGNYSHNDGNITVSNQRNAHIEEKLRVIKITPELIDDLTTDTTTAYCSLIYELGRHSNPPHILSSLQENIKMPWRYKPPPLILPVKMP